MQFGAFLSPCSQTRRQKCLLFMEVFAVICIETSHYMAFVKNGDGQDAAWCFLESMLADKKVEILTIHGAICCDLH